MDLSSTYERHKKIRRRRRGGVDILSLQGEEVGRAERLTNL